VSCLRAEVPAALAGERVDRVVATLTSLSRSGVAALVEADAVRLGGQVVRHAARRVTEGDLLEVELASAPVTALLPDPSVDVVVVYEDGEVIVVDKPAGLVVHPGAGHLTGTLIQGLLARFPELAGVGEESRPGIVHRLDRPTSGLLAVARTPQAHASLRAQLADRSMSRRYLALVWGSVEACAGVIDAPIGRAERDPTRMSVVHGGRQARTRYQVLNRYEDPALSLLDCALETGRTHQIRVHLAAIGHPVVGDDRYGARHRDWPASGVIGPVGPGASPRRHVVRPGRVWLHAARLSFDHPTTANRIELTSPLPPELETVLGDLERSSATGAQPLRPSGGADGAVVVGQAHEDGNQDVVGHQRGSAVGYEGERHAGER
jgi:23S rRNA pseudouridine1911/1915/1917 synthase